ncbi:YtxH domain-containing protein [Pseudogracilibacillus auburnensis]|uniref:YtxH domain-containing protein n=1 Tax=Pseudogracilibacillus auburnensis TaxID=1494959 RepID=UPI001A965B05|nr:YtxH domain-containing protein [Pseudogracilibacillus auburnensis]MBO1002936.1 YtxH domain-containing protein [Pseudogracilibacillus auburnensis]
MSKGKSIAIGFIVGGTISAATALLTTPSSGRELRYQIKQQSIEWKRIVDGIIQDGLRLKDQIAKTSKEGVALINELTQEMQTSVEEWKNAIEPHQENIHEYLEQIQASIQDLEQKIQEKNE